MVVIVIHSVFYCVCIIYILFVYIYCVLTLTEFSHTAWFAGVVAWRVKKIDLVTICLISLLAAKLRGQRTVLLLVTSTYLDIPKRKLRFPGH